MRALPLLLLFACDSGTLVIAEPDLVSETPDEAVDDDSDASPGVDPTDTDPTETAPPPAGDDTDTVAPAPLADLAEDGPFTTAGSDGRFVTGACTLSYRRFQPTGGSPYEVAVVISHGFMRSREQMRGWAQHLASWGFDVYTPDLCHATIVDTDHEQNGRDLAAFGDIHLAGRPVLYIGHSAGGLASLLAGTNKPDALGVLGLDLVDASDLGLRAAGQLAMPMYDLVGDPSWSCNSDGNGVTATRRAPVHQVVRVNDAVHCDFESPTDATCTTVCSWQFPRPAFTDRQQSKAISAMTAAFTFAMSGEDPRAMDYWTPGTTAWQDLARNGLLELP